MEKVRIAVITVSDSCYAGSRVDKSGPALVELCLQYNFSIVATHCVPDEFKHIQKVLIDCSDSGFADIVLTTGGTGFTARDVTPEATKSVIDRDAAGISSALLIHSLKFTPLAMISRLIAGIRGSTLIINFPGSVKACQECFHCVHTIFTHAVDQLRKNFASVAKVHSELSGLKIHDHSMAESPRSPSLKSKVRPQLSGSRSRHSPYEMINFNKAMDIILSEIRELYLHKPISLCSTKEALGRTLASDVKAEIPLPPFRASVKDGYAVRSCEGAGIRKVLGTVKAGDEPVVAMIRDEYCARVNTGAAIPEGADAVVQIEDTDVLEIAEDGEEVTINISVSPKQGQDIREIGCDVKLNEIILEAGTQIGPVELGLLASVGVNKVPVFGDAKISLLSTGDELLEVGENYRPGAIWDANRLTLKSLLNQHSFNVIDLGIARDNTDDIKQKFETGFEKTDVIITTGGVSMGEKDLIKAVLIEDFNASIHFGRINLKPGKPTTFATCMYKGHKKIIFALPGNPVSAYVTCFLFAIPTLRLLSGQPVKTLHPPTELNQFHHTIQAKLSIEQTTIKLDERPQFLRAVISYDNLQSLSAGAVVKLTPGSQLSSRLMSVKNANALVLLPERTSETEYLLNGTMVTVFLLKYI